MARPTMLAHKLYRKLVDEEDTRVGAELDDTAARALPGNFLRLLLSQFLTQLGDAISNPKIILPWVLESVAAPLYLLGLLVPIRESGSMMPQLLIAGYVRRLAIRKRVWILGSVLQALAIFAIAAIAWLFEGAAAGWGIILCLLLFSLARGLCSIASKDVVGKTIPKRQRGRLSGWSASAAGAITLVIGAWLLLFNSSPLQPLHYGLLLAAAGLLWLLAAAIYGAVDERPEPSPGGRNGLLAALQRLDLLRSDRPFRRFVITRALLLCSALTAPYYVVLAQRTLHEPAWLLGMFILASGSAGLLSGPFWGRFADLSSRRVMIWGALITAALGILVYLASRFAPALLELFWTLPLAYFVLSIAHHGVRIGRKTYVVNLAEGNRRTDYVAVGNTVIGILLLALGTIGTLAAWLGISGIILLLSLMGLMGALLATTLPETL